MSYGSFGILTGWLGVNLMLWSMTGAPVAARLDRGDAASCLGGECFVEGDLDRECPESPGVATFAGNKCENGTCIPDGMGGLKCPGDGSFYEYERTTGKYNSTCPAAGPGVYGMERCAEYPRHCFITRNCADCIPSEDDENVMVCKAQNSQNKIPVVNHIPDYELCVGETGG